MTDSITDWLNDPRHRGKAIKVHLAVQETEVDASPFAIVSRTKAIFITVGGDTREGIFIEAIRNHPERLDNHSLRAQWSLINLDALREEGSPLIALFLVARISARHRVEVLNELADWTADCHFGFSNRGMLVHATTTFFFWAEHMVSFACSDSNLPIEEVSPADRLIACRRAGSWCLDFDHSDQDRNGKFMTDILRAHGVVYPELSAFICECVSEEMTEPLPEVVASCDWGFSNLKLSYYSAIPNTLYVHYPVYRRHFPPAKYEVREYLTYLSPDVAHEWEDLQESSDDSDDSDDSRD